MIYDEFSSLKECIVGVSYSNCSINGLDRVIEETNEDLDNLSQILKNYNVNVYRPDMPNFNVDIHHPIMPRDILGVFGDEMYQAYGAIFSRQKEHYFYTKIIEKFRVEKKYKLFHMAKPKIYETEEYEIIEAHTNKIKVQQRYDKYKDLVLWETANMIKCGDIIIHTQSADKDPKNGKGTELGLNWFKTMLHDYRFVEVPAGGHIDGKLAILRPGLLMTWREDFIPEEFKSWDKIIVKDNAQLPEEFKKTRKQRFYSDYVLKYLSDWVGYSEETWFDVNCLSIDENTIVTTGKDKENIKQLENYGFDVVRWNHRHRYFWDGGAHCCTQDLERTGKKESYA
jgi:glycine amidinotransferase